MLNILYVDDERDLLDIGKLFLEQTGNFQVDTTLSAKNAITMVQSKNYDAIISDFQMPEMDGITFLKEIRASPNTIPFIIFTGRSREDIVIQALNEGADFYIQKGGDPESQYVELSHKVRVAVRKRMADEEIRVAGERYRGINATLLKQTKSMEILNRIITTANNATNRDQLLNDILEETLRLLDYDLGGIYLTADDGTATIACSKDIPPGFLESIRTVSADTPPYDTVFVKGWPLITDHYDQVSPGQAGKIEILSLVSVPLVSNNTIIGALNVGSKQRYKVSDEERQILVSIGRELGSIIQRMTAEEIANNTVQNLQTLFNSVNDMVFVLDMQGRILRVNEEVRKRLHYTDEELMNMNVLSLHVPERREEASRIVQGMIEGILDICQVPVRAKDGTRIDVETKVTHGWWDNHPVLIGVTRDVTDRKRAEDHIRNRDAALKILFNAPKDSIILLRRDGVIININEAGARRLGGTVQELDGRCAYDILPPEIARTRKQYIDEVFARGSPVQFDDSRSGIHVHNEVFPVFNADHSSVDYVAIFARDITEQKSAEETLRESEKSYRNLFNTIRQAIYILDGEGKFIDVNNGAEEMYGYRREEFIGKTPEFLSAPGKNDMGRVAEDLRKAYAGETRVFEFWGLRKNGEEFPKDVRLYKGTYFGSDVVIAIGTDITERKLDEETLRLSEERFRSIVQNSSDLIVLTDPEGNATFVSPQCEQVLGYPAEKIFGAKIPDFIHPDDLARCRECWETVFHEGKDLHEYEYRVIDAKGDIRWVAHSATLLRLDGQILGMQNTIRNISENMRTRQGGPVRNFGTDV